nr:MAG TPA: hypothetical protein [Caudoviricetes sp.]
MRSMVRISHTKLDDELGMLKEAYLTDLSMGGVNTIPDGDMLSLATLRLYLRWQMNYNGEADRYMQAYQSAKIAMSLASEYSEVPTP